MFGLRIGIVIWPTATWTATADTWRRAESYGFAHAWLYDHLRWRTVAPWHECFTTLGAAAAITSRIQLGPLVTTPNFRHPVPTAKALLTLADIASGRLIAGIGAGGLASDSGALGDGPWSLRERAERFTEWTTLLDQLLSQGTTTAAGRYYAATAAAIGGKRPRLPLAIAATGRRGMELVARYADRWIAQDKPGPDCDGEEMVRRQIALLEHACAKIGRDPASVQRMFLAGNGDAQPMRSLVAFEACAERVARLGFRDLIVHWPRRQEPHQADEQMLDLIAARLT